MIIATALTTGTALFAGNGSTLSMSILAPPGGDSVSYDPGKILIVSATKELGSQLVASPQWALEKSFDLQAENSKDNFARDFFKSVPTGSTLEKFTWTFKNFSGYGEPETLAFSYRDSVTIRELWKTPQFIQLAKEVKNTDASELLVSLRGWKDVVDSTGYDDPANDNRSLFKIPIRLIPGLNGVYVGIVGKRDSAVMYQTTLVMDSKPVSERQNRFHNSQLEQSCNTCHEGLPSADSGNSMKADCAVCHTPMSKAPHLHPPAEMKECASCHGWSKEKGAIVVDQGVPANCYTCHATKKDQVENSPTPHPVAEECLMCHSSHGTDQPHIVKEDVYTLCTSCHEEQKENHPVGRHPLRYKKVKQTGEEISCVTCHDPHGSANPNLLKVAGGSMEVCSQCH